MKLGGGHAGHNGLRDIHAQLGTADYWRLRLGIGHPRNTALPEREVVDYVLKPPDAADRDAIEAAIERALDAWRDIAAGDMERAMMIAAHAAARCERCARIGIEAMSLKCGIVGLAQRRQVDAVQRADQGGHRRGELSVLHDRAERRHRRGAGSAPRRARRDREAAEGHPGDRRVRRHRGPRRRRIEGRGPRQPVPREHPRDRRDRARRALLRGSERRPRRRQDRSVSATSR